MVMMSLLDSFNHSNTFSMRKRQEVYPVLLCHAQSDCSQGADLDFLCVCVCVCVGGGGGGGGGEVSLAISRAGLSAQLFFQN